MSAGSDISRSSSLSPLDAGRVCGVIIRVPEKATMESDKQPVAADWEANPAHFTRHWPRSGRDDGVKLLLLLLFSYPPLG